MSYFLNHYDHKIEFIPGDFSYNYVNYKPYKRKLFADAKNTKCDLESLFKSFDYKFLNLIDKRTNIEKIILYIEKNYDRLVDTYNKRLVELSKTFNFDKNFFYIKKIDEFEKKVLNNIISIQQINKKIQNKSNIRALDINNFLKNKNEKY